MTINVYERRAIRLLKVASHGATLVLIITACAVVGGLAFGTWGFLFGMLVSSCMFMYTAMAIGAGEVVERYEKGQPLRWEGEDS